MEAGGWFSRTYAGRKRVMTGTAWSLMVKDWGLEIPPPGVGEDTETLTSPWLATSSGEITACNSVGLM